MNLHRLLLQRAAAGRPLRVALIGAGEFGSMYVAQAKHTPGIHLVAIADLSPQRARDALARTGWPPERYAARTIAEAGRGGTTCVTDDANRMDSQRRRTHDVHRVVVQEQRARRRDAERRQHVLEIVGIGL